MLHRGAAILCTGVAYTMGNYWAKYMRKDATLTLAAPAASAPTDSRFPLYVVCKSRPVFAQSLENALKAYTEMSSSVLTACVYMYTDKGAITMVHNRDTEINALVAACTPAPPEEYRAVKAPVRGCLGACIMYKPVVPPLPKDVEKYTDAGVSYPAYSS